MQKIERKKDRVYEILQRLFCPRSKSFGSEDQGRRTAGAGLVKLVSSKPFNENDHYEHKNKSFFRCWASISWIW